MQQTSKVSIITACYNGERFIDTYARSILDQTYKNIEVIFIDDGSTDRSFEKIKEYELAFRKREIVFHGFQQENRGQAAASNVGFQHMTGDYFIVFDIDDMLLPECIEKKARFLDTHLECGSVMSRVWLKKENIPNENLEYRPINLNKENCYLIDCWKVAFLVHLYFL